MPDPARTGQDGEPAVTRLSSEFAVVEVARDDSGNGARLRLTDLRSGRTNWFDPLELEALIWSTHDELARFLDPARRWADD